MTEGSQRCGNCVMFRPMGVVKGGYTGYKGTSHCATRKHRYYGSLVPGDQYEDTSPKPRQTKLPVTANSNSQGSCNLFEPDHENIKKWRKEEEKAAKDTKA